MAYDRQRQGGARPLWVAATLAVAATGIGGYFYLSASSEAAPATRRAVTPLAEFAFAQTLDGPLTVRQTGFIRPAAELELAAEVAGRIARVAPALRVGGRVTQGELLIELEKERFLAELGAAEAQVEQAEAALIQARSDLARQRQLEQRDFASKANLEDAQTRLARARADRNLAEARLTQARVALDDTVVSAPFDAVVVAEQAAPGQLVQPGQSVGRLVRADAAELYLGLSAEQAALFGDLSQALGRTVELFATDGAAQGVPLHTARVTAVDPAVDPAARTSNLVLTVDRPFDAAAADGAVPLRINQLVRAEVPADPDVKDVLKVPAAAVKQGGVVWRLEGGDGDSDGYTLRETPVRVVQRTEEVTYLTAAGGDLSAGDRVLMTDLDAPFDGQQVRPSERTTGLAGAARRP